MIIVERGGEYVLGVKASQPRLHAALVETFADAEDQATHPRDRRPRPELEVFTEADKGHGRVENRTTKLCRDLAWIDQPERWPGLDLLIQVTREREGLTTGTRSSETAWCIASDEQLTAQQAHPHV